MKIKIIVLIGAVLIVLLIGSCSLFGGLSIDTRITQFVADLNTTDRANIIDNFSSSCASYNQFNDPAYWNSYSAFDVNYTPFTITGVVVNGETATGRLTNSGGGYDIKFTLVNDGFIEGWKIIEIYIDGSLQIH